jgi:glyoxylase-like metal-dependent hydrolase (beta-lactamase superfamily II)/rhodanese-related sulfurtransferase
MALTPSGKAESDEVKSGEAESEKLKVADSPLSTSASPLSTSPLSASPLSVSPLSTSPLSASPLSTVFHQFYLGCLAHASYLIGSGGEAAVVDPQRDVDQYIETAAARGLTIKYILETHLHADFVSGHRELAARTGAEIVFGAEAGALFPHHAVRDGDVLKLGEIELRALETPGHTPESICWLILEEGRPVKILTGDTLFIGDVGRPDLAGGRGFTPQQMAGMLYDSLHHKLLALPDDVEVWPAHGAGSACGKNISRETSSTIGMQRRNNYALRAMSKEEFVTLMTGELAAAPAYFPLDAELNRRGAKPLSEVKPARLDTDDAKTLIDAGAIVLDVREPDAFCAGHVRGAINIGLSGQFASWCGTLLPANEKLLVIADDEKRANEAVLRLARVGYENVAGYLLAGESAALPQEPLTPMSVDELHGEAPRVLDVRRVDEYGGGHVPGALHIPLHELPRRLGEVPAGPLAVICAGGYRSAIAASMLARAGHGELRTVIGGTAAWVRAGLPLSSSLSS